VAKSEEPYLEVVVERHRAGNESGLHGDVHIRPWRDRASRRVYVWSAPRSCRATIRWARGSRFERRSPTRTVAGSFSTATLGGP